MFIAHISGLDVFARAAEIAADVLKNSDYLALRKDRYSSFDSGDGQKFENGGLSFEQLREIAIANGEPKQISGKQELYERIINMSL